mmetsp:Transcript_23980/g.60464  ORF Transcript_23980/g.60464 Transcript_23980/m.60464 type:complete len:259 (-) Transcript_23980:561-1337(-)
MFILAVRFEAFFHLLLHLLYVQPSLLEYLCVRVKHLAEMSSLLFCIVRVTKVGPGFPAFWRRSPGGFFRIIVPGPCSLALQVRYPIVRRRPGRPHRASTLRRVREVRQPRERIPGQGRSELLSSHIFRHDTFVRVLTGPTGAVPARLCVLVVIEAVLVCRPFTDTSILFAERAPLVFGLASFRFCTGIKLVPVVIVVLHVLRPLPRISGLLLTRLLLPGVKVVPAPTSTCVREVVPKKLEIVWPLPLVSRGPGPGRRS